MKRLTTFLLALLLTWIGAKAQTITSGTDYLLKNTETGYYLGGGLVWGTAATLLTKPQFFLATGSDTSFTLDSHQYNNETSHYLSADGWVDSATAASWTIAELSDGSYSLSCSAGYLTGAGFQTGIAYSSELTDAGHWQLLTKDDVIASMSEATSYAPVDVTALIAAPELKRNSNTTYYPTWTVTGYDGTGTPSNYAFGDGYGAVANCAESYHSTNGFNINQSITLPLKGYYTLSAKGFYRDDSSTTLLLPVLYAGDQTATFRELDTSANNMAEAYAEFLKGLHSIDAITIQATNDNETITIGFKGEDTSLWNIFGELELLYYGTDEPVLPSHECTAELSHWTTTGNNGTHEVNTWSDEGESDGSGMVTPFCQNWVYGSTLTAATISHETLTDLTPGKYTVSMDIRIFSEAGNAIGTGTTLNANGVSEDLVTYGTSGTYGTETEVYGTYTLSCIVYDDGTLDISIVIPDNVTYNWIAWKNLSVKYAGPITEPAIGYATADKTVVTPGDEVTITFKKVAPSDGSYTLTGTGFTDSSNGTGSSIAVSYTTDGVFTFTVPETAASNSTFTITIPAEQLYYSDDVKSTEQTLTFTVPYMLDESLTSGMFLKNLYNNDLLSRGKDVGTRADVDFVGIPVTLSMNDEGKYTIWYADADQSRADASHQSYLYGTNWAWADGSATTATTFTLEEVYDETTGEQLGYHFISDYGYLYRYDATKANATDYDDDYALAVNGVKGENYSDDNQAIWTFVDKDERDAIKAQWVSDQKVAVATAAGLSDITTADEFDEYVATMTETAIVENEISTADVGSWTGVDSFNEKGYGVESYQTYTRLNRSFSDLQPGIYKITLNGLDRNSDNDYSWQMYQDGYTDLSESYLVAGDYEINLQAWGSEATRTGDEGSYTYTPNGMDSASVMFDRGCYQNTLYTYVGEDGDLTIQIAMLVTEYFGWAIVKNFSLYRLDETITWTMTDAEWGTLILPFDADVPNGLTAYTIGSVTTDDDDEDEDGIVATLTLAKAEDAIKANTPYIMGGTEGEYTFTGTPTNTANSYTSTPVSGVSLTGTFVYMSLEDGDFTANSGQYVLQNHDGAGEGGVAFYPITDDSEGVTLSAYHCYLTYSSASGLRGFISFPGTGDATGIEAVESEEAEGNGAIYDLSGRKVSKAVKGVYIMNGKKVMVK